MTDQTDQTITTTQNELTRAFLTVNKIYQGRSELAAQLGKQFEGERDIYKQAGYPTNINFEQYKGKYKRQAVAAPVVDAAAEAI